MTEIKKQLDNNRFASKSHNTTLIVNSMDNYWDSKLNKS